jgi:hypothetical protein
MGRPKISNLRDMRLKLNLTAAEYECVVRRAEAVAMRPVHYARMLMLDRDVEPGTRPRAPGEIERLNYQALCRVGSSLNQMMRHLHQTGGPASADLEPLLRDIREILNRGIKKWL